MLDAVDPLDGRKHEDPFFPKGALFVHPCLQPAIRLTSGEQLSCRNDCANTHAVIIKISLADPS